MLKNRYALIPLFTLILLATFSFCTFAYYNPDPIPEEEMSAVAEEYYDETDREIEEKIEIMDKIDEINNELASKENAQFNLTVDPIVLYQKALDEYDKKTTSGPMRSAYANYSGKNAVAYAVKYAYKRNPAYKNLGKNDCTNFVSQAIAVGGVYSSINHNFSSVPGLLTNWVLDKSSDKWYMIKKTRSPGLDYWVYSAPWAFVDDFRAYHISRASSGSKHFSGKITNQVPNRTLNESTNFEYKLRKHAKIGQVWQCEGHHSIIITKVVEQPDGYNYVWYGSHSANHDYDDIQNFFEWVNSEEKDGGHHGRIHSLDFS